MSRSRLAEAARKVIERWDSPYWKDLPHTGESINALRDALDLEEQTRAKPVRLTAAQLNEAWMSKPGIEGALEAVEAAVLRANGLLPADGQQAKSGDCNG